MSEGVKAVAEILHRFFFVRTSTQSCVLADMEPLSSGRGTPILVRVFLASGPRFVRFVWGVFWQNHLQQTDTGRVED